MRYRSTRKQLIPLVASLALVVAAVVTTGVFYHNVTAAEAVSASAAEFLSSATEDAYAEGVVDIDLSDLASLDVDGITARDGTLTIEAAGVYSLTGSYSGQIVVDAKGKVYLELNGMAVTSDSGPALWIKDASKVTLVLTDGTANSLADTDTGNSDGAALSSNDSLYVTGTGSLTVIGANSDAISCDDDIVINNGLIAITAAGDGLAANDDITINGGDISVTARGDGLDSNGTVHVNGGSLVAFGGTSQGEGGIDARGDFVITGGTVIAGGTLLAALGDDSRQTSVYVTSSTVQAGGTTVSLDRDGEEVFSYTPGVAYQNLLISSGDLVSGVTYQAYLGGKAGTLVLASR
jgi:hypothetical protein